MSLDEYRRVIAEAATPLKERLAEIEDLIGQLREEKTEIESILRKTDQLPAKNGKKTRKASLVNAETLARLYGQLKNDLDVGETFWASMLADDHRFDWISSSHIAKSLAALHERGDITLHSTGIGGRKIYRVLSS